MLTAPTLRAVLNDQLAAPPSVLVIELTGVTFLGATGVGVLIDARERAAHVATSLRLVHSTQVVARPLEALRLDRVFPAYPRLADALTASVERTLPPNPL